MSIDQYLICPIQFQTDLIFLDFPDGIFPDNTEKQRRTEHLPISAHSEQEI
jgi:hypothetical protein